MIGRLLEFSLRQRTLVLLGSAALLVAGLWSGFHLPIDAVPDITGVQVQVNTEVPALAADESEVLVTQPLEQELAGLPDVTELRSLTKFGLSQITLQFKDSTDIFRARQLVTERLQGAVDSLPRGITPKLAPISTGLGEIFYYSLSYRPDAGGKPASERDQLIALNEIQDYIVKPALRTVPGIAEINATGGYEKQYVIEPRTSALIDAGITFSELADVIGQNLENAGGGIVSRAGQQLTIRAVGRVTTIEQLGSLPIKFAGHPTPLLVRDVANVTIGTKFRTGAATRDGRETIVATTMMLVGENSRGVAQRVKTRLEEIRPKLPAGVELSTEYDRSELVGRTIHTVEKNLFEGAVLVVAVLIGLLGNWRAALIVAGAIPLSFCFALVGLARFGLSGNLMSLGAVDFGLIIDGAVVIVENVVRQMARRQHELGRTLDSAERTETVLAACRQVARPMFFGVVIIAVVYLPILALTGIEGKMFQPMALTVMFALGGALVLALTLMPALCALLLRGRLAERDNAVMRAMRSLYEPALAFALRRRWLTIAGAVVLFALSLASFRHLGAEFVPTLDEGSLTALYVKPVGMSLDDSIRADLRLEDRLRRDFPEITRVFSRIGTSEVATDPMSVNESDVYITYRAVSEWPQTAGRPRNKDELRQQIDAAVKALDPDASVLFAQPIEMRVNELLEGTKAELAVKIFGQDFDVLDRAAEQIKAIIEKTPGVDEVEYETDGRTPQLQLQTRRDVLQRHSLQSGEVNRAVHAALAGEAVGEIVDGNRHFEVVVRMPETLRGDDDALREIPLRVGEHGLLRLGEAVDFATVKSVEPIRRDNGQRRAALMVNLATRDLEGFVEAIRRQIGAEVKLPPGYSIEYGGQFENLQEARARLAIVVPITLVLVFMLVYLAFHSLRQAIIVYSGIPLAVTGGIAALWIRGMPFSISAAVGFIALTGVAVLNGVVLVTTFNQLHSDGRALLDAVREGALLRLRPVLMTAAVASLGFLPMALAQGAGAEVQRPLATVVIGGIISATFLTLLVLPVLYVWAGHSRAGQSANSAHRPAQ